MNTITPNMGNITERKRLRRVSNPTALTSSNKQISFKAAVNPKALMSAADDHVLKVFSQHYGKAGSFLVDKADDLVRESKALERSSRFIKEKGNLAIKDKSVPRSLLENVIFPFVTLPLYAANWVLKKAQSVPFLKKGAEKLYDKPIFRNPRKINHLNESTNQLKGVLGKTRSTVEGFIKERGLKDIGVDDLMREISEGKDSPLVREANDYIKENLYKASNKFFDKHTGNFNTAYERPLNRIVTGLIPVAFLANDAYNLSVLCGDKKEDSTKEAKERTKQEISRVLTTAYIQLLTFGAFTKQVNTLSWFTPLTSALTVLFSETSSRHRLGKPIFFLSKEKAKEYNRKEQEKAKQVAFSADKTSTKPEIKEVEKTIQTAQTEQLKNIISANPAESNVFASFKSNNNQPLVKEEKANDKKKPEEKERKALINVNTFKKGVGILIAGGFALSFIKNSSFTKNSKPVKAIKDAGKWIKEKVYDPLAFKKFEMKISDFDDLMGLLDDVGCKEIADGHRFIKNKYLAKEAAEKGSIMLQKAKLSADGSKKVVGDVKTALSGLADGDLQKVVEAVKTAIKQEGDSISEMKFDKVAKKATSIITSKKVPLTEEQSKTLTQTIVDSIKANGTVGSINVDSKLKPYVDIVIEPFKFIMSAANLPFKLVKTAINLATSPVQKKAAQAALGKAELNKVESAINRAVVEVFGEKKSKSGKISQTIFANAMEQLQKKTAPFAKAKAALEQAQKNGTVTAEIQAAFDKEKDELYKYMNRAVQKSFDGVTQSSNKNTDLAMMTKLASSAVTSAFLVADNYNMVMIKSDGEDIEDAKEKANERIIQRLSALFYQTMFINWFNSTFRATYNSSLKGMAAVAIPNTLTTEIVTRKSIGMPIRRKSYEQLVENEEKNENRKGFLGKYFKFMRLLTGKKPLKDRMPKEKMVAKSAVHGFKVDSSLKPQSTTAMNGTTNLLEMYSK